MAACRGLNWQPVVQADDTKPTTVIMRRVYYVYFLLQKNERVYTGSTNDLRRRYREHQTGKIKTTKNQAPLKIIGYEAYALESDARRRE
jgi:putative endonuclease